VITISLPINSTFYRAASKELLSRSEEVELFKRYEQGDDEAKETLIVHNIKLVISIAKRYQFNLLPLEDLISEGMEGLIIAIDRFDYRKGYKLSTYATWWIRQRVVAALKEKGRTIRLPSYVIENNVKLTRATLKYLDENGTEPSIDELVELTGIRKKRVRTALMYRARGSSLSMNVHEDVDDDRDVEISERVEDDVDIDADARASRAIKKLELVMYRVLTERERYLIRLRFGLSDNQFRRLHEIANVLDLSRERVRQIEARALKKLRFSELNENDFNSIIF